jgi:2-oxoglutarate ferredoxin oxidoreductase subunit alpha
MVYPFPVDPLKKHVQNGTVKAVMSLEMSAGQMIEDVRLAVECKVPVYLQNRMGGNIPSGAEVIEGVKAIFKEIAK